MGVASFFTVRTDSRSSATGTFFFSTSGFLGLLVALVSVSYNVTVLATIFGLSI